MTGSKLQQLTTTLLNGFSMDTTLFYTLLNTARVRREQERPFMRLQKLDASQQLLAQSSAPLIPNSQQALTVPDDFLYLKDDGEITLYDNNLNWETYTEIPMAKSIYYLQTNLNFYIDHANGLYYFTGIIDRTYTVYFYYQADWGDITDSTTWVNIPSRYHAILAYDVAAMYRLGVDYDDINARNAEANAQIAELLFRAMCKWDDALQRSAVTKLDYPMNNDVTGWQNHKVDINSQM